MKTHQESFTPEESMQIITRALSNFKKNYREKSKYMLLWGWVVTLACLIHFAVLRYLLVMEQYRFIGTASYTIWGAFIFFGFVYQFILISRSRNQPRTISHLDRFYIILWNVASLSFIWVGFLILKFNIYPAPFILAIAGMATLISGLVIRYRPVIVGGLLFYVFSIVTAFVISEYQLLLTAVAIIAGYIIPGYSLRNENE